MNLSDLGEGGLLDLLRDWTGGSGGRIVLGPGDDAAVLDLPPDRQLVVSTDAYLEGVHFDPRILEPDEIGHRAMAGSLSDLAAMGAEGVAAFVNLHAQPTTPVEFLRRVYQGMDRIADSCGVVIAGGDCVRGPLALGLTVLGHVGKGEAIRRDGAREGDVLCVSGELGGSEVGRRLLSGEIRVDLPATLRTEIETAFRLPRPRFDVSRLLTSLRRRTVDVDLETETIENVRPSAMMDVSDGLGIDLLRLCEASHVGCRLEERIVPISPAVRRIARELGLRDVDLAMGGGEDYQLLFTMRPEDVELLLEEAKAAGLTVSPIGSITSVRDGRLLLTAGDEVEPLQPTGWDHFRSAGGDVRRGRDVPTGPAEIRRPKVPGDRRDRRRRTPRR
jgi:thiamine-monophosphate kinase